jgi:uncharacterized phage protein gp47/JayE
MPGQDLLNQVGDYFDTVREIAVDVQVTAPTAQTVDVSVAVTPEEGEDFAQVEARVRAAVEGWFTGERLGRPVLRAELTALLFAVEGVANCAIAAPADDVAGDSVILPVMGTITVTQTGEGAEA